MSRFPLFLVVDGKCTCSEGAACTRAGKHPSVPWANLVAGESIQGPEGCGYGLATGERSGCFVVDCDSASAAQACREAFPATRTVLTPRGGAHFYFRWPGFAVRNSVREFEADTDIRGDGGFVVLEGSMHKNGTRYRLDPDAPEEIADAPPELLQWEGLRRKARSPEAPGELVPVDLSTERGREALEEARAYLASAPPCVEGQGGDQQLWHVALRLMRTLELPIEVAWEEIQGFNARCAPPWPEDTLRRKLIEARDSGDKSPGQWLRPSMLESMLRASKRATAPAPSLEAPAKPRRTKTPGHAYAYEVTALAPSPMISKGRITDVITYLSSGEWAGVLQYDEFAGHPLAVDPPIALRAENGALSQSDATSVRALLEHEGIAVGKDMVYDALEAVCYAHRFDPLREWIMSLPPGDPKIFDGLACRLFGSQSEIQEVYLRHWFMGVAARALVPGILFQEMLILTGAQGVRKSTFARSIVPHEAWFCDALPALESDNVIRQLHGKLIVEVAELVATKRSDIETQKAFTSRSVDRYTQKYERHAEDHPRRCVFIGTTNEEEILRDPTGNRRYWCIEVLREIPIDWFLEHRDQIIAAARDLFLAGEPLHLSPEERALAAEQTERFEVALEASDTWTERIAEYCAGKEEVAVSRVLNFLGVPIERQGVSEQRRVGACLRSLGLKRELRRIKSRRARVWIVPEDLRRETPSPEVLKFK